MWLKLDDGFADHPKIDTLSDGAFRLHVSGLCYAAKHLTDGMLPARSLRRLTPTFDEDLVAELVAVGLWHRLGEVTDADGTPLDAGFELHDFLDYNPTAAEVKARREKDREKKRRQRARGSDAVDRGDDGRFRTSSPSLSPGDTRGDAPGESPATRPVPSRPSSSSSPPPARSSSAAPGLAEEEEALPEAIVFAWDVAGVLAERALELRTFGDAPPILNRRRWLKVTTEDRFDQHRAAVLELHAARPELTAAEIADELEPDLARPRPAPARDRDCPECAGSLWRDVDDGVVPCSRCVG